MKNRRYKSKIVVALIVCFAGFSDAARTDEITLIMVPREDTMVNLGMDLVNQSPTLLVSYLVGKNGEVSLHGWSGSQWVSITLEDFQSGNFFRTAPDSVLIIEKSDGAVPEKIIPSAEWCHNASKITTTKMRPLLHLIGQYYDFSYKTWSWFSTRYSLPIEAINPEELNVAWFHKRMDDHFKSGEDRGYNDLQFWVSIRQSNPVGVIEISKIMGDESSTNMLSSISENPFTNEVPSAVIMGAADAPEEHEKSQAEQDKTKDNGIERLGEI